MPPPITTACIESRIAPDLNSGCWLWMLGLDRYGYGRFRGVTSHRASWVAYRGEIPSGLHVCHHCDTPACVNPSHLFVGTASDNMRDMIRKGRQARGSRGPGGPPWGKDRLPVQAKLTANDVTSIRQRRAAGESAAALALVFSVTKQSIRRVVRGATWSHVT